MKTAPRIAVNADAVAKPPPNEKSKDPGAEPILVLLRDVEREDVPFLWHPYLPMGKLTIADGDPGTRKSWLCSGIATAVSLGLGLPADPRQDAGPQKVLILAGEDGLEDTVRPRMEDMGADLNLITALTGLIKNQQERVIMFDADGLVALEEAVRRVQPTLVIIDPLVAFIGGQMDMGKSNEVRALLRPLANMAQQYGFALICTRHLTKSTTSALYRGQGSIDFNATARSVLGVAIDPDNPEQSIVAHIKSSLTRKGMSQPYSLVNGPLGTELAWGAPLAIEAEELFGQNSGVDDMSSLEEAKAFLTEVLFEGPLASSEVAKLARDIGVADRTLRRAKTELGVTWRRAGQKGHRGANEVVLELSVTPESIRPKQENIYLAKLDSGVAFGQVKNGAENGAQTPNDGKSRGEETIYLSRHTDGQVNQKTPEKYLTNIIGDREELV